MNTHNDNPNETTDAPRTSPELTVPGRLTPPPGIAAADPPDPDEGGKEGEGGARPAAVSNRAFLDAIFADLPEGAALLVHARPGDPSAKGGWIGIAVTEVDDRCRSETNNYFTCASFFPLATGDLRALEAQAAAYHCLVLDDVGTKTGLDQLPSVEPTWVLETSPGNFQVGFKLATPITDFEAVKNAQKRIFGSGLGDKGAGGVGRWVRLPNGINGKAKYQGPEAMPFRCRLAEWRPERSYELDELVELLAPMSSEAVDDPISRAPPSPTRAQSHATIPSDVFRPALPENPVVTALKAADLYKRQAAHGVHEITCPWVHEHTDGIDSGACYFEPAGNYPLGGFKCQHSHGDVYRLGALLKRFELTRRDVHNKPCIRIVEGELQAMVDAAQVILASTGEFFQSGGLIKRVVVDPVTGHAAAIPQTDADLTLALSNAADWERCELKNGISTWRRCNPLPTCLRLLTQAQTYAYLPPLKGIARQPFIDRTGRVVSIARYDPQTQIYCAFEPSNFDRGDPSEENARAALERVKWLLREFHFASERDLSTALSAIITAVLRPGLGLAPAFHVRAPSPGSGKSLLCDLLARFASPGHPAKMSYPLKDEEATKVILATLIQAPAVIDFDDMSTDWRPWGVVNRLLTSETITDRVLGVSQMATVTTETLVLGSGNNTGPIGDLNRRVVVIDLDPKSESPATLRYEGDPLRQMEERREAFVADVLLIVESWIAAGSPKADLTPIASYKGRWTDFCRQPLVWLGLDDPAVGLVAQLKDDPDIAALGALLAAWHLQFGHRPVTLRALMSDPDGGLPEAIEELPFVAEGNLISRRSRMGRYLKRNAGRPVGGLKLEKAESGERNAWRVVPVDQPGQQAEPRSVVPPSPPLPPSSEPAKRPSPRLRPRGQFD